MRAVDDGHGFQVETLVAAAAFQADGIDMAAAVDGEAYPRDAVLTQPARLDGVAQVAVEMAPEKRLPALFGGACIGGVA